MNIKKIMIACICFMACYVQLVIPNELELSKEEKNILTMISIANRANKLLLESFDCQYTIEMTIPEHDQQTFSDSTYRKVTKKGRYAFKGDKDYSREELPSGDMLLYVRNGSERRVRSHTPLNKYDQVLLGSSISQLRPGTPDPWTLIDGGISCRIEQLDTKKDGYVTGVETIVMNGRQYIKVTIKQDFVFSNNTTGETARHQAKVYIIYDPSMGYMPVENGTIPDPQGSMQTKSKFRLKRYELEGNELFIPVEMSQETTIGSSPHQQLHYIIDVNSVRLNPELEDDLFVIDIHADDQVINKDLDIELQGPGGMDFLIDAIERNPKPKAIIDVNTPHDNGIENAIVLAKGVKIDYVYIPQGRFLMGSPDTEIGYPALTLKRLKQLKKPVATTRNKAEGPQHLVNIDKGFFMSKTEITREQYSYYQPSYDHPSRIVSGPNDPVIVTWKEAVGFCEWLSKKTGHTIRLPYENEWEYACRAGTTSRFFWGDREEDGSNYANLADKAFEQVSESNLQDHCLKMNDGYAGIAPVGSFSPNAFGLYDMLGNVSEWCCDYYQENAYQQNVDKDSDKTLGRVKRGGSYSSGIIFGRCASRWYGQEDQKQPPDTGFRVIIELKKEKE